MEGALELKPLITKAVRVACEENEPDNPIYRGKEGLVMREVAAKSDTGEYVMRRLDVIERLLNRLTSTARKSGTLKPKIDLKYFIEVEGGTMEKFKLLASRLSWLDGYEGMEHTVGNLSRIEFHFSEQTRFDVIESAARAVGLLPTAIGAGV
jgi:hypothetical protein